MTGPHPMSAQTVTSLRARKSPVQMMPEAVWRTGGDGLTLSWFTGSSRYGPFLCAGSEQGIVLLRFLDSAGAAEALLRQYWPRAQLQSQSGDAWSVAAALDSPVAPCPPLYLAGTTFRCLVWRALLELATGEVTSYSQLAARIGRPDAVRAVAGAVAANPVAVLVPCHRVRRADGALGGYAWGPERKAAILHDEALMLPASGA